MRDKFKTMLAEDYDEELNAMNAVTIMLKRLTFDQQWRIINYVLVRLWGRTWLLARPKSDNA